VLVRLQHVAGWSCFFWHGMMILMVCRGRLSPGVIE
jgi:hypothetical protein